MDGNGLLVVTAIVRESKTCRRKRKRDLIKEYEELSEGCIKNGRCSAGSHIISLFFAMLMLSLIDNSAVKFYTAFNGQGRVRKDR